eukprot:c4331_g1_i2.p2 GENE.c4331_g1_i2~~c4331_g1_i2.p2  ORF type:complete len:112 (+),score=15.87 c4331_g1_i2:299-634(+)
MDHREHLGTKFVLWVTSFMNLIEAKTHKMSQKLWIDAIDPRSGLPIRSKAGSSVFVETEDVPPLMPCCSVVTVGCCKIISHNVWKSRCLFGLCVTNAPPSVITEVLAAMAS